MQYTEEVGSTVAHKAAGLISEKSLFYLMQGCTPQCKHCPAGACAGCGPRRAALPRPTPLSRRCGRLRDLWEWAPLQQDGDL